MPLNELPFHRVEPVTGLQQVFKVTEENGARSFVYLSKGKLFSTQLEEKFNLLKLLSVEDRAAVLLPISYGQLSDGRGYIQTEWIESSSLAEQARVEGSTILPVQTVIQMGESVSRALTLCHQRGLIHGSINEQCILQENATGKFYLAHFSLDDISSSNNISAQGDVADFGKVLAKFLSGSVPEEQQWAGKRASLLPSHWAAGEEIIPDWLVQAINGTMFGPGRQQLQAGDLYVLFLKHQKHAAVPFQGKYTRSEPQQGAGWALEPKKKRRRRTRPSIIRQSAMIALLVVGLITGYVLYTQHAEGREKFVAVNQDEPPTPAVITTPAPVTPVDTPVKKKKTKVKKPAKPVVNDTAQASAVVISDVTDNTASAPLSAYKVRSKAYFHNQPDPSTRRKAFITHWNNAVLHPLREENDFVYVVFTNAEGQTSKGWIKKAELEAVE